jgi:hypothetical protein
MEMIVSPPGDGVVGEEVAAERTVGGFFPEAQAEERDADEVDGDEDEVRRAEVRGH